LICVQTFFFAAHHRFQSNLKPFARTNAPKSALRRDVLARLVYLNALLALRFDRLGLLHTG
jgi:hypothetical protein